MTTTVEDDAEDEDFDEDDDDVEDDDEVEDDDDRTLRTRTLMKKRRLSLSVTRSSSRCRRPLSLWVL